MTKLSLLAGRTVVHIDLKSYMYMYIHTWSLDQMGTSDYCNGSLYGFFPCPNSRPTTPDKTET